jgi:hypothetical protein
MLPSGPKLTLGLLGTITLEVVSFRAYSPFPVLLPFLIASWKLCFWGVQHRLWFYLDHLNCVKMAAFQLYLQSWKQWKLGWVGDDSRVVFGQKFPGEKGSDATASCFVASNNPGQVRPRYVRNPMHIRCSFVRSIAKSHQDRYTTPSKRPKKSALPLSCVKFSTLTPKIC